jgi:uncharacterized protein
MMFFQNMKRSMVKVHMAIIYSFLMMLLVEVFSAQTLPPPPVKFIVDDAKVLTPQQLSEINEILANIEKETSCQVVVAIYNSLPEGEVLEEYANRLFRSWGIGQKQKNNGLLLLIFINDRKLRIEVGYGLEGVIPDAIARRIIGSDIAPFFKTGDYARGIKNGIRSISLAIKGEYRPEKNNSDNKKGHTTVTAMAVALFILVLIWFNFITRIHYIYAPGGRIRRYGGFYTTGSWGSIGRSSGGWGGGFSGGGGSSGGGGASGSW